MKGKVLDMNLKFKECILEDIRTQEKGYGSEFVLKDKNTQENYTIKVDESIERIANRIQQQVSGNSEKDGIYLSRCMTNIDINTRGDKWDINEEALIYYGFDKQEAIGIVERLGVAL
jgi:hypothetical protein